MEPPGDRFGSFQRKALTVASYARPIGRRRRMTPTTAQTRWSSAPSTSPRGSSGPWVCLLTSQCSLSPSPTPFFLCVHITPDLGFRMRLQIFPNCLLPKFPCSEPSPPPCFLLLLVCARCSSTKLALALLMRLPNVLPKCIASMLPHFFLPVFALFNYALS
jgi:hypothetical protein